MYGISEKGLKFFCKTNKRLRLIFKRHIILGSLLKMKEFKAYATKKCMWRPES